MKALKNKHEAKTPTDKMKFVKALIPILAEVQNKIIRAEYVKMVASTLHVDEHALQSELNKLETENTVTTVNFNPIVTKNFHILEKAQKNLLSCYFSI